MMNATCPQNSSFVVEVEKLVRRFGPRGALREVSLRVPRGEVFGLVGENGAGKTTLIKHLLGLLKAQAGSVRVFGLNPVADPAGVLGRIGYLSEDRNLPEWMSMRELLRYTRAFYPRWDARYAEELRGLFQLDPELRVRDLSRGQKARAALLIALAHRPELLLLDEPSSGLDPLARRDILGAVIRTVADEGRTVIFSSHLLDEVERVADRVAMIHEGHIVLDAPLEELKQSHCCLTLRFDTAPAGAPKIAGVLWIEGSGREWMAVCNGRRAEIEAAAAQSGARVVAERVPTLEEIFVARVGARPASAADAPSAKEA